MADNILAFDKSHMYLLLIYGFSPLSTLKISCPYSMKHTEDTRTSASLFHGREKGTPLPVQLPSLPRSLASYLCQQTAQEANNGL